VFTNTICKEWKEKGKSDLFREAKMLAALMDSRLLLPFIFLLCSLVCVFLLFFQRLLKSRRWWRGWPAGNLFWFWVFIVCRDEGNGRANTRLCVLLLSCSLRLSVYYFFLWIYALFFLCSFLQFLVFHLGLASVFFSLLPRFSSFFFFQFSPLAFFLTRLLVLSFYKTKIGGNGRPPKCPVTDPLSAFNDET